MTAATGFDAIALGSEIQRRVGVKTSRDEPLARFTTMRVGGPADLFLQLGYLDPSVLLGVGFTNAVRVQLLP